MPDQPATTAPDRDNTTLHQHAAALMRSASGSIDGSTIRGYLHNAGYRDGGPLGERPTEADVHMISALISTARVTVDWPGSTHHADRIAELDALLTQAYDHNDTTQEELASLTAGRDQYRRMEDRVRSLLVAPDGDRDDSDTITVAQLRAAINGAPAPIVRKHPHKASPPPGGWPSGGQPITHWGDCADCGDTIFPDEHVYPAGATEVRCAVCEVRTRRAGLGSSPRAQEPGPIPPAGWSYLAAVHHLQNRIQDVTAAAARVEAEQARLTPVGVTGVPEWLLGLVGGLDRYHAEHPKLYRHKGVDQLQPTDCPCHLLELVPAEVRALAGLAPAVDVDQAAIERLLATAREGLAVADSAADATEIVSGLLADWYATWPAGAATDPHWPIAAELVRLLVTPAGRATAELERLRLGMLDRTLQPEPTDPADTATVDTALRALDHFLSVVNAATYWRAGAGGAAGSGGVRNLADAVDELLQNWPGVDLSVPAVSITEVHAEGQELATGGIVRARGIATVGERGPNHLIALPADPFGLGQRIAEQDAADPVDEGHALAMSSVIAASNRFAAAARGEQPGDWVRFTAGNGRTYEGWRRPSCPGDGVTGHTHDILCVDVPAVDR